VKQVGELLTERMQRIVVENEMLRAGFAAVPYIVIRDVKMSIGARFAYAILLMYSWQEGSCFPGQQTMAALMGVTERTLRRWLSELRDHDYISWRRTSPGATNTYYILDAKSKLKAKKRPDTGVRSERTNVTLRTGHQFPTNRLSELDPDQ